MVVMPSDHAIPDTDKFLTDLRLAIQGANEDHLVTFGIKPSGSETGYGYVKVDKISKTKEAAFLRLNASLKSLISKPQKPTF
jgi:mannose-1-phosphate guanylyltransferase